MSKIKRHEFLLALTMTFATKLNSVDVNIEEMVQRVQSKSDNATKVAVHSIEIFSTGNNL